jgi:hypothetical protein
LDTTTPAAPCSAASTASSAVITPLTRTGSPQADAKRSTSSQVSDGSISSPMSVSGSGCPPWTSGIRSAASIA